MDQRIERLYPVLPQVGCSLIVLILATMCLLPLIVVDAMEAALAKLHLTPPVAMLVILGIFVGGLVNVPLYRFEREVEQMVNPTGWHRLMGWTPLVHRSRTQTIIAANVGGCLIPLALTVFELFIVLTQGDAAFTALAVAVTANVVVCYLAARPIQGVGIMMPGFLPPLVAVGVTWLLLLSPEHATVRAPVAFVAGVAGPLVGADLLHLRDVTKVSVGMLSIGGAGTFDGIVLSGILAALVA